MAWSGGWDSSARSSRWRARRTRASRRRSRWCASSCSASAAPSAISCAARTGRYRTPSRRTTRNAACDSPPSTRIVPASTRECWRWRSTTVGRRSSTRASSILCSSAYTGVPVEEIGVAVDGCGVACFALPLSNMALAYTRLEGPILEAMMLHPELIAGEGRPCTEMMRAHPGRVVAKVGAEGIYSALLTREELGVTLKVEDGHSLASALAIAAVLAELGLKPQPESLLTRPITNSRGETVGEMRVIGGLSR